MDTTSLMLSVLFGAIGMGFLVYGKKAGRLIPIVAGLGLMIIPYTISNNYILTGVCAGLTAMPFLMRDL
jgi:hypothetical protein